MRSFFDRFLSAIKARSFDTSHSYWEERYLRGGTSGPGSYGRLALFKASVLNEIVAVNKLNSVIEFGSGDGAQLALAKYPTYLGVDVSPAAVAACRQRFADDPSKAFIGLDEFHQDRRTADLALSLDVIYHLVEDDVFTAHMDDVFGAATRFVAIYSSNSDRLIDPAPHVRHRRFSNWIDSNRPDWTLVRTYKNPYPYSWWNRKNSSRCDMFLYARNL